MIRRFQTDPDTLSPEALDFIDTADRHLRAVRERGVYSPGKPGDNFAIGLDSDYNPFPVANPVADHEESSQD